MKKEIKCYALNIVDKFDDEKVISKAHKNIYQLLKRLAVKNPNYKDIYFIMGISNTDSHSAKIGYVNNYATGRPQKIILGKKIKHHLHIYIFKKNGSPASFCEDAKFHLKKMGFSVNKTSNDNIERATNYLLKQCTHIWKYRCTFSHKISL
ncbi:MAG: hypothetical protein E7167_00755 [Firmicutes bacterium]|nr:hypothetical protein [Bacillota bacterium]